MASQYIYDDGSAIGVDDSGNVLSRDVGSSVWVDDPTPAPAGWSVFANDNAEAARMSQGYPSNGSSWWDNAAMMGVSRLIDTAGRTYAAVKGSTPATYAGQNGQTYVNGTGRRADGTVTGGGLMPLLLLGALAFALTR